ncbi:hypothetical protein Bca52824_003028 [Brassica carinata]|uniref:glucan endo-1,3-beta-D-glucosidase n=1 Tax=Brassica carinata TaxID=52824 RepID=A0A8X7WIZ5_BRACI|nr:hypothetical protein Bca52824_003028 [Brassica carinata]
MPFVFILLIPSNIVDWIVTVGDDHQVKGGAFVGTYGINYGRIADNIPSPDKVVLLLKQAKIRNVPFSGTGLDLVVGLPNGFLKEMSSNADHALTWVKDNVQSFLPQTRIRGIAIETKFSEAATPSSLEPC